jgi:type II secretory pathway pseudopilin PulG
MRGVRARGRSRAGFTLGEVIIAAIVVGVLAAVTIPNFTAHKRLKAAEETADILTAIGLALNNSNYTTGANRGFVHIVKFMPLRLTQLQVPITTADKRCSNANYVTADVTNWNKAGPYLGLVVVPNAGVPTPFGFVHDSVKTAGVTGFVEVHIDTVETEDAAALDLLIDRTAGPTVGFLRYQASLAANTQLVRYLVAAGVNHC